MITLQGTSPCPTLKNEHHLQKWRLGYGIGDFVSHQPRMRGSQICGVEEFPLHVTMITGLINARYIYSCNFFGKTLVQPPTSNCFLLFIAPMQMYNVEVRLMCRG